MAGPSPRVATAAGAGPAPGRRPGAASRALGALAALALAFAAAPRDADAAWRLAAGSFALAALALAVALPWALVCLVYLAWYAPPWLARGARPALRSLASLPSLSVGLGAALAWPRETFGGGALAPAAVALGAFAVPALVLRGDRLLEQAAPLRAAALAVGARPFAAFALVVWPAVRTRSARALVATVVTLFGEAASVVVIARALGVAPPTLAAALVERRAPAAVALLLALSLALGAVAAAPEGRPARR